MEIVETGADHMSKKLFQQEQYFPKKVRIFNVKVTNFIVRVSIYQHRSILE
jgi:hypothetical protein